MFKMTDNKVKIWKHLSCFQIITSPLKLMLHNAAYVMELSIQKDYSEDSSCCTIPDTIVAEDDKQYFLCLLPVPVLMIILFSIFSHLSGRLSFRAWLLSPA